MKSKLIVNFNGTKEGITLSVKCDPGKTLYILALSKRGNLWGYSGAYSLSNDEVAWYGPLWYRPTKFQVYEMINGEVTQIDEITNERYGVTTNFYLLSGESIEAHFAWCNAIKEYSEKFNCKAQVESDYADVLASSFPELHFYTEMPKVALRSNYIGYNGNIIAPNEQKIINIFEKYGPILEWSDLKELSNKSDVSEPSLNMMMQFSVLFQRIDRSTYMLSNNKPDLKNIKTFKIDISNESYSSEDCEFIENENAYIDVYDFGEFKYKMNYPRPLRKVLDKYKGVMLDNRVFITS